MPRSLRLTLLCALALVAAAGPTYAEAETAAEAAPAPAQPADAHVAPQTPAEKQERSRPSGCPYRDGKLELIV